MKTFALIAFFFATSALADPAYFRVTGVAADDTLNIRELPDASSADIGNLPPDAEAIEVIEIDESGKWGRILWFEGNGWLSMRFLEPDTVPGIGGTSLPVGLLCGGNEPFWSLRISDTTAVYSDPTGASGPLILVDAGVAQGRPSFPVILRHASLGSSALSIVTPQSCGDGMSDRDYGYGLTALLTNGFEDRFLDGCCWLPLEVGAH